MRFQATHKLVTYLLVLSSVVTVASTDALSVAALLAFLAAWALSWPIDAGGRAAAALDRVAVLLRAAVLAAFAAAGWQVWRRLPEPDLAPVLNLVLALLAYKLFHRRANRDYLHIYVLSFLLVLAASALAGTVLFAAAFAVYVVLATWTLILFHLRREMEENYLVKHSAQAPSQKVGVARILNSRRVVGRAFFAATGVVALGVFVGAVATFALVPRVGAGFVFGAARPTENVIGFSDDVSLGHYGVLSAENRTVALRATLPLIAALPTEGARDREIERLYWRGTVYDRYDRGHWTRSRDPALRTVLEDGGLRTWLREPATEVAPDASTAAFSLAGTVRQEIDVVGVPVPVVFALDQPVAFELPAAHADGGAGLRLWPRWSGEVALRWRPFGAGNPHSAGGELFGGHGFDAFDDTRSELRAALGSHYVAYSVDALAHGRHGAARDVADLPAAVRAAYLALPGSLSPRVDELARRLTAGHDTAPAKVLALLDWLRAEHAYTLRLPRHPDGVDPVEDFLFDRRAGHCEYFASAMVVLLRAAGIPARYVNGYLGGEWNQIGRYVTVRDNRAHSWAEAYLGPAGWLRVDATPPAPGAGRAGRVRQLVESLEFYWTRWVVGYDLDRQLQLVRRLGRGLGLGSDPTAPAARRHIPGWAVVLLAVAALAGLASRRWLPLRARQPGGRPPVRGRGPAVHRLYRRAMERLSRAGFPRRPAETPREFAARVAAADIDGSELLEQLTELYTAARFGGRQVDGDVLRDLARRMPRLGRGAGNGDAGVPN